MAPQSTNSRDVINPPTTGIPLSFSLSTPRCVLRCPSENDFPDVLAATRVNGFNDGLNWEPPESIAEFEEPHKRMLERWMQGTAFSFGIYARDTDAFVGRIAIRKIEEQGAWDLGFWTHPSYQGQGYMSEVLPCVIDFGFDQLGAETVQGGYAHWNIASQRIMEKMGMVFVRSLAQGIQKRGEWVEVRVMETTRDRWKTRNSGESVLTS